MELLSYGVSGLKRDVLKEAVEKTESGFIDARGNKAFGTVTANEGEYLFVSIPYDEGFTVKVNGKKVKAEKVFGDFYSIPLTNGLNKIEMVYFPAGFISGLIMAVFGLAICILLAVFSKKEKSKVRTFIENKLGLISKPIFILFFVLVIGLIYIMPVCINIWFK
jgi:phosphotransferase system  glucose/maltose/N-acetylglucosamine-specific IIC component